MFPARYFSAENDPKKEEVNKVDSKLLPSKCWLHFLFYDILQPLNFIKEIENFAPILRRTRIYFSNMFLSSFTARDEWQKNLFVHNSVKIVCPIFFQIVNRRLKDFDTCTMIVGHAINTLPSPWYTSFSQTLLPAWWCW